jgi:hypothetical protein
MDENGMFACPLLDSENGCMLGTEKPFECRIWPLRIMSDGGRLLIAIAPICEPMMQQPIGTLLSFLKDGIADAIFAYAAENPDVIRSYDRMCPILMWKPQEHKFGGNEYVKSEL